MFYSDGTTRIMRVGCFGLRILIGWLLMPKLVGMLRVKNGMFFLKRWLEGISPLVDEIVVVDNGSTDGSLEVLTRHPNVVAIAQTEGLHEGRDINLAYYMARQRNPDWVIWLDVDEVFESRLTRKNL